MNDKINIETFKAVMAELKRADVDKETSAAVSLRMVDALTSTLINNAIARQADVDKYKADDEDNTVGEMNYDDETKG